MCLGLLASFTSAWAQGGTGTGTPAAGGILIPAAGGDYRIAGEEKPELYKEYAYKREMPDGSDDVYWHIEGAATINGDSAGTYPNGNLDAAKAYEVRVQWDDSATVRLLQLRRGDGEKVYVLAELLVRGITITNKIMYHGQAPNYAGKLQLPVIYTCATNPVSMPTGTLSGEPHQFQMESNCSGNSGPPWSVCSWRPNFIWTIRYYTGSGTFYEEKYADRTAGDFSKVWLYFYQRIPVTPYNNFAVPPTGTRANWSATLDYGGVLLHTWPNFVPGLGCPAATVNTATAGDVVTRVNIQCTGYSCGVTNQPDSDEVNIYYLGLPPAPITLVNNPATPLCRGQSYQVETAGTTGATGYTWTANNGAQIVGIPGTGSGRMTLNLANVPVTATSVTVTVTPANGSTICAGAPQTTTLVIPLSPAPAPQNMRLTGRCPSPVPKNLDVDLGVPAPGVLYNWRVSGQGALFSNLQPSVIGGGSTVGLITNSANPVTVTVQKQLSPCGGFGPAISTTYQIGNVPVTCGNPIVVRDPCPPYTARIVFEPAPTGLAYNFPTNAATGLPDAIRNSTNPYLTIDPASQGQPVWNLSAGTGRSFFDLTYIVQSTCGGPGSGLQICTAQLGIQKVINYNPYPCRPAAGVPTEPVVAEPQLQLYPNPTSGAVEIKTDTGARYQWLKVFDAQGSLRYQKQSATPEGIQSFDLKTLMPGIYLVQLFDGEHLASQRLVKE